MKAWAGRTEREQAQRPKLGQAGKGRGHQRAIAQSAEMQTVDLHRHASNSQDDLLKNTAKLALATARQVRCLTGIATKTISIPDTSLFGPSIAAIARKDHPLSENMLSHTWAQVIVAVTDNATDALPADVMQILHNHVRNCAGPEILRDLIK
jgi:hypothetical protein